MSAYTKLFLFEDKHIPSYLLTKKPFVVLDIIRFTLYIEQQKDFNLYIEQQKDINLYIEKRKTFEVER